MSSVLAQGARLAHFWLAPLLLFQTVSAPVLAQTTERAGARATADQGFDAFRAGDWKLALDRFERAESVVHSLVHLLFIGQCQAKLGLLVEAKELYLRIAREELPAEAPAALKSAQQSAGSELAALEQRIPLVNVVVTGAEAGAGAVVSMDGAPVPNALVGVPYPVNPGEHTWRASVAGIEAAAVQRSVNEASRETIELVVSTPVSPVVSPVVSRAPTATASPPAAPLPLAPVEPLAGQHATPGAGFAWGATAGFAVGAVGLGVGAAFALKKQGLDSDIDATCRGGICPGTPRNLERESDANAAGSIASVAFIGAGAGIATAITLLVLRPSALARHEQVAVSPWLGSEGAGVRGHF